MELREVSATTASPYRCYVRGKIIQTEGENVQTIGFKDGLAVVQVQPLSDDKQHIKDNVFDSKAIDLTKLKKIIVKVDPQTGKKYLHKDGKKIEIRPQVTNLDTLESRLKLATLPKLAPIEDNNKTNIPRLVPFEETKVPLRKIAPKEDVIRTNIVLKPLNLKLVKAAPLPKLVPNQALLNSVKYHLSVNMKKGASQGVTVSTMTDYDLSGFLDKDIQTDSLYRRDVCTQTKLSWNCGESPSAEDFYNFILSDTENQDDWWIKKKMIDPNNITTKEDLNKFQFFRDMRNALNFDNSGNLPIHESVIRNDVKAVQKNCVVLKAIRENVNILNQQNYAPLHLGVLHDVDLEIIKVLLNHGADLRVADAEGNTAIHLAIEHRRSQMLKVLVNGAIGTEFNFDVFNYEGFTPLILACLNRSYLDAKLLLLNGADPNVKDMKSGRTALFHAAESHDVDLVELLMHHKADTKIRNFFGTSPHDAMFELDDIPMKIKFCILGRDHQRFQNKRKQETKGESNIIKKAKLETTPVLRKVTSSDVLCNKNRKK